GGLDFGTTPGTVTFAPGVTNRTISIPIVDDGLVEGNETFTVELTNLTSTAGAVLGTSLATGAIVDNDFSPGNLKFDASSYSFNEDVGSATLTVQRTNGTTGIITVDYFTTSGTATGGVDYATTAGTLTFADGETSKVIMVPIINDSIVEGDET